MDEHIRSLQGEIMDLKILLAAERARSKIYKDLVTSNTNIKFREIIRKTSPNQIPDEDIIIETEQIDKTENPQIETQQIDVIETKVSSDEEIVSINTEINDIFERLKIVKSIGKTITELQKKRELLMMNSGIDQAKEICKDHITKLSVIFAEKGYSDKKIEGQIAKSLTSMEMRFLKHPGYPNSHLDVDDQQKLIKTLETQQTKLTKETPFNSTDISKSLMNYGSVLINMKTNIQRVLSATKNIIYIENSKSTKTDPFSFYTLASNDNGKFNWVMDCRLEELTLSIRNDIFPFLVKTFKELYFDVFGDNVYRKDYKNKCYLTECDCQQLLSNIYAISSNNNLNNILKTTVRETSTYTPTDNDKFNILSDDAMQKKRWKSFCSVNDSIVRDLFDEISNEDAIEFENTFTSK